jgi:hypothetical protein
MGGLFVFALDQRPADLPAGLKSLSTESTGHFAIGV